MQIAALETQVSVIGKRQIFPKMEEVREKWIAVTGRKDWKPTSCSRICSQHFDETCFKNTEKIRTLRPGSIPTFHVNDKPVQVTKQSVASASSNQPLQDVTNNQPVASTSAGQMPQGAQAGLQNQPNSPVLATKTKAPAKKNAATEKIQKMAEKKLKTIMKLKKTPIVMDSHTASVICGMDPANKITMKLMQSLGCVKLTPRSKGFRFGMLNEEGESDDEEGESDDDGEESDDEEDESEDDGEESDKDLEDDELEEDNEMEEEVEGEEEEIDED